MRAPAPNCEPVLVTGAGGFIGACAVRRLLAQGSEVHALVRPGAEPWRLRGLPQALAIHSVDLLDRDAVREIVRRTAARAVLHLATHGAYEPQDDGSRILQTNVLGTYHILDAALAAKVRVFVSTGTSSEYGYKNEPMREDDRLEPNSVYAVAKAAQTHLCSLLGRTGDTAVVTFRLFSVYGPWEEPTRLIPTVLRRARAGQPLRLVAPETARDFVYVDDVLDLLLAFELLAGLRGQIINLGTGVQSTMRDVVAAVEAALRRPVEVRWHAMPPRRWDTARWQADVSRAQAVLGWSPRHTLAAGVARMAAWMSEVGDAYGPG
jgi:nucleoside-diphosphate-sugar epimerase